MAEVDGTTYEPGGASEVDELMDLFALWREQEEAQKQKGTGYSGMMDDD
jgi:hypothetical protein